MTTPELISFIRNQIKNKIPDDITISKLTEAGWHKGDIEEGFFAVQLELKPDFYVFDNKKDTSETEATKSTRKTLDQYRESVTDDIIDFDVKKETPITEIPKITPTVEVSKVEAPVIETPKVIIPTVEAPKIEVTTQEIPKAEIPIIETPKVEVPVLEVAKTIAPIVEIPKVEKTQEETYDIEIPDIEVAPVEVPKTEIPVVEPKIQTPAIAETYDIEIPGLETPVVSPTIEIPKVITPVVETPKEEIPVVKTPVVGLPVDIYKEEISAPEISVTETPIVEIPKVENPTVNTNKIWTPMRAPIIEKPQTEVANVEIKKENTEIEIQNQELPAPKENILETPVVAENLNVAPEIIQPTGVVSQELIPTLKPKVTINPFYSANIVDVPKPEIPVATAENSKNFLFENLPKAAMLSSYENDFSQANKADQVVEKKSAFKIIKWLIMALVLLVIAGTAWAFISGFINIENIPFIKKDPKVLLLNNSKVLSSLKSYKTETNIEISSPSFANISSGLISGEVVPSADKDSISIKTLGSINQNDKGIFSSNYLTVKSSLLSNDITADIKNNNSDLFITVSDMSQIIKESDGEPLTIKINETEFDLVPALFSLDIEAQLKKINLFKILSNGIPSYINTETMSVYDEFINSVKIIEKGQESIKGIDTYHYSINAERPLIKKLLSKIVGVYATNLDTEDQDKLDQILGSATVESFEVWVGKGDNNIYQTSVVLNVPLSKILSFEDKSIGDNQVRFAWKTTYYDFNISNNITIPDASTPITDFVKAIKETKIKNDVSTIKQLATNLLTAEGVFGKSSNPTGSCMSPVSGSLFSPVGHTKGATTAVSSISELLNKVLKTTNNEGSCYSTPKAWSFTIPVSDNYDIANIPVGGYQSFFCIDNTGLTKNIITPPKGVVCE